MNRSIFYLRNQLLNIYILAVIIDLIFVGINFSTGRFLSKALLMPLLILFIVFDSAYRFPDKKTWHIVALLFSFIGDMVLQFGLFIPGLVAFLTAHAAYIYLFMILDSTGKNKFSVIPIIITSIIGVSLGSWMAYDHAGIWIPVCIYSILILYMGYQAFRISSWMSPLFLGAICFIISDFILAHGMFKQKLPFNGILVMVTYCLAQYWIAIGIARGMIKVTENQD